MVNFWRVQVQKLGISVTNKEKHTWLQDFLQGYLLIFENDKLVVRIVKTTIQVISAT